jgi:hypothetical protein
MALRDLSPRESEVVALQAGYTVEERFERRLHLDADGNEILSEPPEVKRFITIKDGETVIVPERETRGFENPAEALKVVRSAQEASDSIIARETARKSDAAATEARLNAAPLVRRP